MVRRRRLLLHHRHRRRRSKRAVGPGLLVVHGLLDVDVSDAVHALGSIADVRLDAGADKEDKVDSTVSYGLESVFELQGNWNV